MTADNPDNTPPPLDWRKMDSKTFAHESKKFVDDAQREAHRKQREADNAATIARFGRRFPNPGDQQ